MEKLEIKTKTVNHWPLSHRAHLQIWVQAFLFGYETGYIEGNDDGTDNELERSQELENDAVSIAIKVSTAEGVKSYKLNI